MADAGEERPAAMLERAAAAEGLSGAKEEEQPQRLRKRPADTSLWQTAAARGRGTRAWMAIQAHGELGVVDCFPTAAGRGRHRRRPAWRQQVVWLMRWCRWRACLSLLMTSTTCSGGMGVAWVGGWGRAREPVWGWGGWAGSSGRRVGRWGTGLSLSAGDIGPAHPTRSDGPIPSGKGVQPCPPHHSGRWVFDVLRCAVLCTHGATGCTWVACSPTARAPPPHLDDVQGSCSSWLGSPRATGLQAFALLGRPAVSFKPRTPGCFNPHLQSGSRNNHVKPWLHWCNV